MKSQKILLMLAIIGTFVFNACKDEDKTPDPNANKTKTELMTGGNWKLEAAVFNPPMVITYNGTTLTVTSLMDILKDCEKDNLLLFNADGTMTVDNGVLKCESSEPQTAKDGNWKFINNETQVEITDSEYFNLLSSGDNKVVLNDVVVSENQLTGNTDYTYVSQSGPVTTKINFTFKK